MVYLAALVALAGIPIHLYRALGGHGGSPAGNRDGLRPTRLGRLLSGVSWLTSGCLLAHLRGKTIRVRQLR